MIYYNGDPFPKIIPKTSHNYLLLYEGKLRVDVINIESGKIVHYFLADEMTIEGINFDPHLTLRRKESYWMKSHYLDKEYCEVQFGYVGNERTFNLRTHKIMIYDIL